MASGVKGLARDVDGILRRRPHWSLQPSSSPGMPAQWCLLSGSEIELSVTVDGRGAVVYVMDRDTEVYFDDAANLAAWLDANEGLFLERSSMADELFVELFERRSDGWGGRRP